MWTGMTQRVGGLGVFLFLGVAAGPADAQQAPVITYNTPIQIQTVRYNADIWANAASRHRRDAAEILINDTAGRDKGGASLFMLRKIGADRDKGGEVQYGDSFEIWSFFAAGGLPSNAGVFADGRKLSVVDDGHPQLGAKFHELVLYNVLAEDGPVSTAFKLTATEGSRTGPVRATDKVKLTPSVLGQALSLRAVKGSRYPGSVFNSLLVGGVPPGDTSDPNGDVFVLRPAQRSAANAAAFDASKPPQ